MIITGYYQKSNTRSLNTMKKLNKKGFTIVELVIVIAVIAILATILIPTFSNVIAKANDAKRDEILANAYTAYTVDVAGNGNYADKDAVLYVYEGAQYKFDGEKFVEDHTALTTYTNTKSIAANKWFTSTTTATDYQDASNASVYYEAATYFDADATYYTLTANETKYDAAPVAALTAEEKAALTYNYLDVAIYVKK